MGILKQFFFRPTELQGTTKNQYLIGSRWDFFTAKLTLFLFCVFAVLPSTTPTPPGTSTDPANPGETEGDEEDGTQSQGVPLFATVITASCVGLVLLFSAVLLVMICCLCCHRHKLNNGR